MQFNIGDKIQIVRSSGKIEWDWTINNILPGYRNLPTEVVVVNEWQGQSISKVVELADLIKWQTWAVCDTHENLTTCEAPSANT